MSISYISRPFLQRCTRIPYKTIYILFQIPDDLCTVRDSAYKLCVDAISQKRPAELNAAQKNNTNHGRPDNMKQALKLTFVAMLLLTSIPAASAAFNGTPVELDETDVTAICKDIARDGNSAWIELEEYNNLLYRRIMTEGDSIPYTDNFGECAAYKIDTIFRGTEYDLIECLQVDQPITPATIGYANEFDNFILDLDEQKDLGGGITLRFTGIDLPDGAAWIELLKNGTVQYSHILQEGDYFTWEDAEIGIPRCCRVYRVFAGVTRNLVEFSTINPVRSDFDASSVPDRSDYIMVGPGKFVELSGGAKLLLKQIDQGGEAVLIEI